MDALLVILAISAALIPFGVGSRYGLLPWVSPLHIVSYYAFFGVVLKTIALLLQPEAAFFRPHIYEDISILSGYVFLTGFLAFVSLGYVLGVRRRADPEYKTYAVQGLQKLQHPGKLALAGSLVFFGAASAILAARGISGLSSLFSIETIYTVNTQKVVRIEGVEGFGQSFAALKTLFIVPTLAFVVWVGRQIHRPTGWGLAMALTMAMLVIFMIIFEAKRLELLNLVIYYLCIYVLLGNKIEIRAMLKLAVALAMVIGIFAVMTTLRATKGGLENAEFVLLEALFEIASSTYFIDINMPIIIIDRFEHFEPFGGESYVYWLFGWIPREFWPSKPAITLGPFVKQEIFGIYGSVGGINPTGAGEAMLNFRWAGVFVGLFLGFIYRRIEEYILKSKTLTSQGGLWVYPLVFYPFVVGTLQSSFSAVIISSISNFFLLRLALFFFSDQHKHGRKSRMRNASTPESLIA